MASTNLTTMEAIDFVECLIKKGKNVGIFSCEDPYNTPFHNDVTGLSSKYIHLKTQIAGDIVLATLDLGLQAKGIDAWGIFGHYGIVHGHEVCAAIKALNNGHFNYGPDLRKHIETLSTQYKYQPAKSSRENVIDWVKNRYELLSQLIPEKQSILKGAVQGNIIIFGGLVENSHDGKSYKANILFSNSE